MASTVTTDSMVYERRSVHKYHWPAIQLNIWMLIMLVAASTIVGIFAIIYQHPTDIAIADSMVCSSTSSLPFGWLSPAARTSC